MARLPMMAANWKMNNTISEAVVLSQEISNRLEKEWKDLVEVVVIPPFVDIKPVKTVFDFDRREVAVGAQNVYWEAQGAYTGEISVPMLAEIGCKYCIVGHSERRQYFEETNEDVNRKIKALISGGISPIVCVGESLHVREDGNATAFVLEQVKAAFAGIGEQDISKCVLAYEPVWAIGTGRTATPEQANNICKTIRLYMGEQFSNELAQSLRILYGGSMNPGNVHELIAQEDIDGGLIGGAGLKAESFIDLIKACL